MTEESESYGARQTPANEPDQDWGAAYYGLFGKRLDDEERNAIETVIETVFRGSLRSWEMTKAVRYLAMAAGTNPRRYPPSGEEIIRQIKANRYAHADKQAREGNHDHPCQMGYGTETVEKWQRLLRDCDDGEERWNIICRPTDAAHCAERERFCKLNSLRFKKYDPSEIKEPAHV